MKYKENEMKAILITLFILVISITFAQTGKYKNHGVEIEPGKNINGTNPLGVEPVFGNIPLYFIPNKGQVSEEVLFYAVTPSYTLWITGQGLVFDRDGSQFVFSGANRNPKIVSVDTTDHRVNYFKGKTISDRYTNISTSRAILYKAIYKNIDLKIYGKGKQIEYDWIVKPGGDPADIKFAYKNVKSTCIDDKGNLLIETEFGKLVHHKPVSFQVGAQRAVPGIPIDVKFKRLGKNSYCFAVGEYDKNRELVIDPVIKLDYSTFLDGSDVDYGCSIAVDSKGCAYLTGRTYSVEFPTQGPFQDRNFGECDTFVCKISPAGDSLVYSTYLGGDDLDHGESIVVDSSGCAYVAGWTFSKDFPTTNPFQAYLDDSKWDWDWYGYYHKYCDIFITKLSPAGDTLVYSTFLGGNYDDAGEGISLDSGGCAYITGATYSENFPVKNPFQASPADWWHIDAFVTKISPAGDTLYYSTYLGGTRHDLGESITVDSSGYAWVTGRTYSPDFPLRKPWQGSLAGNYDVFVTKLGKTGKTLAFSTYIGGSDNEGGYGIVCDGGNNVYVTGYTVSSDFPTRFPAQGSYGGGDGDAFVFKLSPTGGSLLYATYLGGRGIDYGKGIRVDNNGSAYVTGSTSGGGFPCIAPLQGEYGGGDYDAFVTKLSPPGSAFLYSTYLGGEADDEGHGIAVDSGGCAYVTGRTRSVDFPMMNPIQADPVNTAVFVTKLGYDYPPTVELLSPLPGEVVSGMTLIRAKAKDDVGITGVNFSIDGKRKYTDSTEPYEYTWNTFPYKKGSHDIEVTVRDTAGQQASTRISVDVQHLVLTLRAERRKENAWIISREYGKIDLEVKNPGQVQVSKYLVYRKEPGREYRVIKSVSAAEFRDGTYTTYDLYLDKDKSYTYKAEALDAKDMVKGVSNEQTI
ncbi:MAG: SBBP repeat-containing protein [Candidatus Aminicenantes bacterium]|nr:SBBP repeat-containing protein [Candidatus Aminicenantes bacterium]